MGGGGRLEPPAVRGRRRGGGPARLAGVRGVGRQGCAQARPDGGADLDRTGRARHARAHGVLRAAGSGAAEGRRDRRGLGGVRGGWRPGRPDREAQGMPRGGAGRLGRQGRLPVPWSSATTPGSTTEPPPISTRRSARPAPAGSTSTSTTWAAGSPRRCRATSTPSRGIAVCGLISQYNLTEPELAPRNERFVLVQPRPHPGLPRIRLRRPVQGRAGPADGMGAARAGSSTGKTSWTASIGRRDALLDLLEGRNFGKKLVRVGPEPDAASRDPGHLASPGGRG